MDTRSTGSIAGRGFFYIAVLTLLVYSNSFNASWHLDDYDNIVRNPGIHLTDLAPDSIKKSFYASVDGGNYNGDKLFRPVAMFSFALNWYLGKNNVFGYHLVNFSIHVLTGFVLFLTIQALLKTPNIKIPSSTGRYHIALMSALIWVVHPIQVSCVTYIVQRMALLAALFYVTALYTYCRFRSSRDPLRKGLLFLLYCLLFALGMGSKENTILLPLSTLLIEVAFYRKDSVRALFKPKLFLSLASVTGIIAAAVLIWTQGDLGKFLVGYEIRPFTPLQRLMTEGRVIWMYLYQLIYPVSSQFSVEHDILISQGLTTPWTTLPAILGIVILFGLSIMKLRQFPLISFAILFYFLNHSVESTILNLELVFEHRNYLPSMFLFLPFVAGCYEGLSRYLNKQTQPLIAALLCFAIPSVFIAFAMGTYIRNIDWKTEKALWEDAIEKAPQRARPYQSLAVEYYQRKRDWDNAMALHYKALDMKDSKPAYMRMVGYDNLRFIYQEKGDSDTALKYAQKAVNEKNGVRIVYNFIEALVFADELEQAEESIDKYLKGGKPKLNEVNLKTIILLKRQKNSLAYDNALEAMKIEPLNRDTILYFGYACLTNRYYEKTEYYLNKALKVHPAHGLFIRLCLLQNTINQNSDSKIQSSAEALIESFPVTLVHDFIEDLNQAKYPIVPIDSKGVMSHIKKRVKDNLNMLTLP